LYYKQNQTREAITALENVSNYSPTYDLILDARIELAKSLRKNGEPQKALDIMQNIRKESKYSDNYHRIDLEIALSLIDLKRLDEGIQTLVKIDTSYSATPSAGLARFELGKIFENRIPIYDSASTYYAKASTSTGSDSKMMLVANEKTSLFKKYQYIRSLMDENKKQLNYLINPADFIKDSIAFYSDTLKSRQDDPLNQNKTQNNNDRNYGRDDIRLNPTSNTGLPNTPYVPKKKPPAHPVLSIDTLKSNLVKNEFDLGNVFFNEFNRPDSASYYYNDILSNYSGSKYEARTLYSLGIYFETLNDTVKADSIYSIIYDHYRTEKVVNAAAVKLNKPLLDFEFDPAKDLYADAETDMVKKNFNVSLDKFYGISVKYPKSPLAPKALYASGWILENDLKLYDSAAVVYDTLTTRYPKTVYASKVYPKLYYYKEELQRKKTALQDSLAKLDSLATKKSGIKQDSLHLNIKSVVRDSLHIPKDIKPEPPKRNNIPIGTDSLNNSKGVLSDSLKRINNKLIPDTLKNNKNIISDSLKKDINIPPKHK
jgi:TolA-binding protein